MAGSKKLEEPGAPIAGQVVYPGQPSVDKNLVDPSQQQSQQSQTQQPSYQMGAGTGFVNIDRILGANNTAGRDVLNKSQAAVDAQRKSFQDEQRQYQTGRDAASKQSSLSAGDLSWNSSDPYNTRIDKGLLDGSLANSIKGINYGDFSPATDSENTKKADALGNAATAGRQLASDSGQLAQYDGKLSSIDSAIYGYGPNKELLNIAKQGSEQEKSQERGSTNGENAATAAMKQKAEAIGAGNVDALKAAAKTYGSDTAQGKTIASLLNDPSLVFGSPGAAPVFPRGDVNLGQIGTVGTPQGTLNNPTPKYSGEGSNAQANAAGTDEILRQRRQRGGM